MRERAPVLLMPQILLRVRALPKGARNVDEAKAEEDEHNDEAERVGQLHREAWQRGQVKRSVHKAIRQSKRARHQLHRAPLTPVMLAL